MISGHLAHSVASEHFNDLLRTAERDRLVPRGNRRRRAVPAAPGLRASTRSWTRLFHAGPTASGRRLHVG